MATPQQKEIKKQGTTIYEKARRALGITRDQYAFCAYVAYRCADSRQKFVGWCCDPKEEIADFVGISRVGLFKMAREMEAFGLVEISGTGAYRGTPKWIDTESGCKQSYQEGSSVDVNKVNIGRKQSLQKARLERKQSLHAIKRELDIKEKEREGKAPILETYDEFMDRVRSEAAAIGAFIEAKKKKGSPVPAAPSFSGSDISDEADELKNGVVRRDGPNYEAKNKKGSPVSANPLTIHSGFNEVFDAIYEKDENGEYKIRHDVEPSLPVEFDIEIHVPVKRERVVLPPPKDEPTTPLYQPTNPDAAKALISRMKITPKADNEMDARKLIVEWCEAHGEQVKWAYESAKRKHTPEDLAARIIDFSGHFATTDQSGKQLSFFNDPAFMFKNGLTKWLQRQNQFDRDKATKDAQPKNGFAQPVNQSAENRTGMYRKITDL
jgi:hypothetical protein